MAKPKTREQIEFENRKNIFKLGALVFAVLVIVAIIGWIIEAPKTAKINVLVAPTDAKVTIGGKKFNNRCFLLISFANAMAIKPVVDTLSTATPLAAMKAGETVNITILTKEIIRPAIRFKNTYPSKKIKKNIPTQSIVWLHIIITIKDSILTHTQRMMAP